MFKGWGKSGAKDSGDKGQDPVASELDDPKKRQQFLQRNMRGGVEDNIFQDEIEASKPASETPAAPASEERTKESLAMVVDPDARSRIRWQRKKVIQMVRRNGELTREERIRMTERELLHKSEFMPTSVKKLVMLARQIAGKPVDEAIQQMTWSKKKFAAEVKYHLEEARDMAVVQRGMGLGKVNGDLLDKPRKVQTKDGKWIEIVDPTRLYVAQSWVGRGPWRGKELDYKGRGRMGIIQHPSTSKKSLVSLVPLPSNQISETGLLNMLTSMRACRLHSHPEGRKNQNQRIRRAESQGGTKRPLGSSAEPQSARPETILFMVEPPELVGVGSKSV